MSHSLVYGIWTRAYTCHIWMSYRFSILNGYIYSYGTWNWAMRAKCSKKKIVFYWMNMKMHIFICLIKVCFNFFYWLMCYTRITYNYMYIPVQNVDGSFVTENFWNIVFFSICIYTIHWWWWYEHALFDIFDIWWIRGHFPTYTYNVKCIHVVYS